MSFKSDNIAPVDPHVLNAINEANTGLENSYGHDQYMPKLKAKVSEIFEKDVEVFLVSTGGISNCLALSALCKPYQTIYCHHKAHINVHEAGLIESMGHKLTQVSGELNKVDINELRKAIAENIAYAPHMVKPGAISITQSTEIGTLYSMDEIKALKEFNLPLHMDGARFTNALVTMDCTPAELTWKAGVDVLSLGGTKNGAMMGEMIIFFNKEYAEDFEYRMKRAGQLYSKMRYLAAQMIAYFDVWIKNAKHANEQAAKLSSILSGRFKLAYPAQTNQVFFQMEKQDADFLKDSGVEFYNWENDIYRFVTHFMTRDEEVKELENLMSKLPNHTCNNAPNL